MLAFGDLLHRIHPLAGQGFNMTIRDIKVLVELINARINLGIQLDSSICSNFEKKQNPQIIYFLKVSTSFMSSLILKVKLIQP